MRIARIAALSAQEARTHRDVGGEAALSAIGGFTFDPARTISRAVAALDILEDGGAGGPQAGVLEAGGLKAGGKERDIKPALSVSRSSPR